MGRHWGDGRYQAVGLLGRGGSAEVWRARDESLNRDVAIKVLVVGTEDAVAVARFRTEMTLLTRLNHPHVVSIWDAGFSPREPWFVMPLLDGGTLARPYGGPLPPLPPDRAAAVGAQIADALACVHAAQVVHRDLKPANILLDRRGGAYLSDFGIARLCGSSRVTGAGLLVGTAAYLAPEQVRGEAVGTAADVYALGLVLLEQLTGRREYQGTPTEAAVARLNRPPDVPAWLGPRWRVLLTAMTALEPDSRPRAGEVCQALRTVDRPPVPVDAPPVAVGPASAGQLASAAEPPARTIRRPAPRTLVAALFVAAVVSTSSLTAVAGWRSGTAAGVAARADRSHTSRVDVAAAAHEAAAPSARPSIARPAPAPAPAISALAQATTPPATAPCCAGGDGPVSTAVDSPGPSAVVTPARGQRDEWRWHERRTHDDDTTTVELTANADGSTTADGSQDDGSADFGSQDGDFGSGDHGTQDEDDGYAGSDAGSTC